MVKRIARRKLVPKITTDIVRYGGNPSVHVVYKGNFTLDKVKEIILDQQKRYRRKGMKNAKIGAHALFTLEDEDGNKNATTWRSIVNEFVDIKQDIDFPDMEAEDYFGRLVTVADSPVQAFEIVILQTGKARGGAGYHNDCLYDALKKAIPTFHKQFPKPELFKKHLKLERDDPVPIEYIPLVEDVFPNHKINVIGHHTHTSSKDAKFTVTLVLNYEHYSLWNAAKKLEKGIAHEEKVPVVFQYVKGDFSKVRFYDGKKYYHTDYDKFCDMRSKPITCPYVFVKLMKSSDTTMKESYENFMTTARTLKEYTGGKYNLFKTGNIKRAALHRFIELNPTIDPEPFDPVESDWISKASHGSLMYAQNGFKGKI